MASFLYFIPGIAGVTRRDIERVGLGAIFPDRLPAWCGCEHGPGGTAGVVCVAPRIEELGGAAPKHGYYPPKQTWLQRPALAAAPGLSVPGPCPSVWVGYETDAKPRPQDLHRPEMIAGYNVRLEDGNDWLVPVARSIPRGSILPRRMSLGPNGEIVWECLPRFAAFSALAEEAWLDYRRVNGWLEADEAALEMTAGRAQEIAVAALAMNYRVGLIELAILQVLSTANMIEVLDAMIDVPAFVAAARRAAEQKKNSDPTTTPDGCSSNDGSPAA